jgi:hypothetical protein
MPSSTARARRPSPLPLPPADLEQRSLILIHSEGPWLRLHWRQNDPFHFGRGRLNRFDAPDGEFGVLYAGCDLHCSFIETYGQSTGINVVTETELAERRLCRLSASRPLRLVDLTGEGLARLGVDERLCAGDDFGTTQRWSLALWRHPALADGLYYRARHDPARLALALFDRAASHIQATPAGCLLDTEHQVALEQLLDTYGFGLMSV